MNAAWRNMLWALLTVRETTRIALLLACLSILLGLVVDRSDRGLPWILLGCGQGLMIVVHIVAPAWCWWTLEDSLTRRRARLTCVLIASVVCGIVLFCVALHVPILDLFQLGVSTWIGMVTVAMLSVLVAVAIIGVAWLSTLEAIGRDSKNWRHSEAARRLSVAWITFSVVAITLLLVRNLGRAHADHQPELTLLAALLILQLFYLRLVRGSCHAVRAALSNDFERGWRAETAG